MLNFYFDKQLALNNILHIKRIKNCTVSLANLENNLENAYSKVYHAVCFDIDNTLIDNAQTPSSDIIDQIAKLSHYKNILCFITGRGTTQTREFLRRMIEEIMTKYRYLDEDCFKRWFAIVNNGVYFLRTEENTPKGFLHTTESLIEKEVINDFVKCKDELRYKIAKELSPFVEPDVNIYNKSKAHGSGTSLRFPFEEEKIPYELQGKIVNTIMNILKCDSTANRFTVTKGTYVEGSKKLCVFEIALTNKGQALGSFERLLGIPEKSMLRIGDQGDFYGNDYDMLNSECGFSVGNVSQNIDSCFPVLDEQCKQLFGSDGVLHLLKHIRIYPAICLEKNDQTTYKIKMASIEREARAYTRKTLLGYARKLPHLQSSESTTQISDIIDTLSGAIYFMDCEWAFLDANVEKHMLSSIFMIKDNAEGPQPHYLYSCQTDDGILLRGPALYYHGLCQIKDEKNAIDSKHFEKWMYKSKDFVQFSHQTITKAVNQDNASFHIDDYYDRKLLLGVIDNVRNILLLWYNISLELVMHDETMLLRLEGGIDIVDSCYQLVKKNSEYMFKALFGGMYALNILDYVDFLRNEVIFVFEEILRNLPQSEQIGLKLSYGKALRTWREIDNFFENVIAVDIAIQQYIDSIHNFRQSTLYFYAIRYGGIELPILAEIVCKIKYNTTNICQRIISQNMSYNEKQSFDSSTPVILTEYPHKTDSGGIHIVFDDNLATGKTLQIALNGMVCSDLYADGITIVRYPTLNRLEQMFSENASATPDISLFFCLIRGLVTPSPYTRLNKRGVFSNLEDDKYLDELGVFDLSRQRIKEYLYKNGCYIIGSEVAALRKV